MQSSPSHPTTRRGLIVAWLLFFFQFGAIGIYYPFLNIYYLQNGLSGTEIGLLGMAGGVTAVIGASLWGYLGDRTRKPRLLLVAGALAYALFVQILPQMHSLWGYFAITCLAGLASAGLPPLVDNITLTLLGDRSENYGRYRLGGSIGYIFATAAGGLVLDKIGLVWIFPLFGAVTLLFAGIALFLPPIPLHAEGQNQKAIREMIRHPNWLIFVASVFLVWIAAGGIINFMGVALHSMGADQGLVGLVASAGSIVEIPFMLLSGTFMKKYGTTNLFWFSILVFTGRLVLYGVMPVPSWAIFIGMLNGPSYAFFWSSAVNHARDMAPEGYQTTAQGLLNSVVNLAYVATSLFCGYLFDQMGAHGMFLVLAVCCFLGFLVFWLGSLRKPVSA